MDRTDRIALAKEVLIDSYVALRCRKFLGNGQSNVSAAVAALKPWNHGECVLLLPSLLHAPNMTIYDARSGPQPDAAVQRAAGTVMR
jgi:hypothetical protein